MNLFLWALFLASPAAGAGGAAVLPASWDQCFCSQPTDDPFQPYKNVRYGAAPGCGETWRATGATVWFGCKDALLANGLLRCSEVPALASTPQGDCYCAGKTGISAHPREAVRWNWSPAYCDGVVYVDLEFRAEPGRRQVPLPRCEADAAPEVSPATGAK